MRGGSRTIAGGGGATTTAGGGGGSGAGAGVGAFSTFVRGLAFFAASIRLIAGDGSSLDALIPTGSAAATLAGGALEPGAAARTANGAAVLSAADGSAGTVDKVSDLPDFDQGPK